jgi:arylsulfatase A-like enzyme
MSKPNVILIMVDQLRAFEVGCYGNFIVKTPNIDSLAANGMRFDTAVTNNPVCTPARSSLLTGQYGRTCTGELGNVSDDPPCQRRRRLVDSTIADCFRSAGYDTALIGKWHIDPSPMITGFDYALYPLTIHRYAQQTYIENDDKWFTVESYSPDFENKRACEYIAGQHNKPFFLFYNIPLPHNPIGAAEMPERFAKMFDPMNIPLRDNVWRDGKLPYSETWFKVMTIWDYFWRIWGPCWNASLKCEYPDPIGDLPSDILPENFNLRSLVALYYDAVAWVDELLGNIVNTVQENGLADNTMLVFVSDHGDNLGSHHLFNKDCLFEESIRIPLIMQWMGQIAPRVNHEHIAQIIDIAPTILAMCGVEPPATMQGRDLSEIVSGDTVVLPDNWAFIEIDPSQFGQPGIGIRTPRYLYGMSLKNDERTIDNDEAWFYDLQIDHLQQNNLAGVAEYDEIRGLLKSRLQKWHLETMWLSVDS